MSRTLVAGVDSSTQSCTVELRDAETGESVALGRAPHAPTFPPVSEQDPRMWWDAFTTAWAEAVAGAGGDAGQIGAISVAGQCHGLVMLDRSGGVVRPAKLWNDTTSAPQTASMLRERDQADWIWEILSPLNPAFTITKLRWMAENEPDSLARTEHVLLPHDYLNYRLTGEFFTDRSEASGTGYFNGPTGAYLPNLLRAHVSGEKDWEEMLPTVLGPQECGGTVHPLVARELGLRPDALVGAGGGDQHIGALGIGLTEADVAFSLGTSGVVMTTRSEPLYDLSEIVDSVCDAAGGYLPLVSLLNCTKVTDTVGRILGADHDEMAALALSTSSPRLTLLAHLDGERSPMLPGSVGILSGLRSDSTRADVARAAFEGVVSALAWGCEILDGLAGGTLTGRRITVGGGSRSAAYTQFLADMLDDDVWRVDAPEAVARGACVQAAAVLAGDDVRQRRDEWAPRTEVCASPRSTARGISDEWKEMLQHAMARHGQAKAENSMRGAEKR